MLTLVVHERKPLLGRLVADGDDVRVELSRLGVAILREEVCRISVCYPMVAVWKVCIMPDHIHLIVRVKDDMPKGKHLGAVVRGFKTGCSRAWWRLFPTPAGNAAGTGPGCLVPSASPSCLVPSAFPEGKRQVLFEAGYNDRILARDGQLDNWKHYLDDNPRRLFMKRRNPRLFTVLHDAEVMGRRCQMVGNRFLLDVPDKMAVIVHRRYTDEENERLRQAWLACGERGGVLVSAAIAPKEKAVLREAMNRGYRIVLLRENGFSPMYKPVGESFDYCSRGLLLQISPWEYHTDSRVITRRQCLELNALAEAIAGG